MHFCCKNAYKRKLSCTSLIFSYECSISCFEALQHVHYHEDLKTLSNSTFHYELNFVSNCITLICTNILTTTVELNLINYIYYVGYLKYFGIMLSKENIIYYIHYYTRRRIRNKTQPKSLPKTLFLMASC